MQRSVTLPAFLLAGCMAAGACADSGPELAALPAPAGSALEIGVAAAGEERIKLEAAWATVEGLMAQETLWKNFQTIAAQHTQIYVGREFSTSGMASPAQALAVLRGNNPAYRLSPAQLTLTGTYYDKGADYVGTCTNPTGQTVNCRATFIRQSYSNELVVTHGIRLYVPDGREIASIEIGRQVFDRYNSTSKVRKSCTFNSLAHEWTHTIGKVQNQHWSIVVDTDVSVAQGVPQLSYLFGSVAQCTWLQGERSIGATEADLKACVSKFAAVPFPASSCV